MSAPSWPRLYGLCTTGSGADILRALGSRRRLAGIIGLTARDGGDAISGYQFMGPLAEELGVPFVPAVSYALTAEADRARLLAEQIDVLLVTGWQRLVPQWLIDHSGIGVVGVHGSPNGISGGRGRSPQNWALILGAPRFQLSIFLIDRGVDSGAVLATREFDYLPEDDISTSYLKTVLATTEMIEEALSAGAISRGGGTPQTGDAYYLPQRLPEDGAIDWSRSAAEVCRFVAALTRPYPGAFCECGGRKLVVWRARPFLRAGRAGHEEPGTVVWKAASGQLVVAVGDGRVCIDDYHLGDDGPDSIRQGTRLSSTSFLAQMQRIVERHRERYPEQPLSPDILRAAGLV